MSPVDIEVIIDNAVDDMLSSIFEEHFTTRQQIDTALTYLKEKINNYETDDFEDLIDD